MAPISVAQSKDASSSSPVAVSNEESLSSPARVPSVADASTSETSSSQEISNTGNAIAEALAQQTKFNVAMALGRCPSMYFAGELYKYVQFVTMFRGSFDKTINDPVALYEILLRHTTGAAKSAIEPCIFSAPNINRYEEAMSILKYRYGPKSGVIRAHRERLLAGRKLVNSVADFEKLSNDVKSYCSVLEYYGVDMQYFACDVVRDVVHRRMSMHSGREFSKLIQRKCLMENTALYLPKLCEWVNERIVYWQSELGSAWVHRQDRSSTKSF